MARKYKAQGSTVVPVRQAGGLTPVYDTSTGKWKYEADPDSTKMEVTLTALDAIKADSATALSTADTAKNTAEGAASTASNALATAQGKTSLEAVKTWVGRQGYATSDNVRSILNMNEAGFVTAEQMSTAVATALEDCVKYEDAVSMCNSITQTCSPVTFSKNGTSGGLQTVSDARLKEVTGDVGLTAEEIGSLPAITFTYKDDAEKTPHCGSLAQEVRPVIPEAVGELPDGTLTMDYGGAAWVAVVSLAREVERLKGIIEN